MNISWVFMVSQQTINADSNWAYLKSMVEGLNHAAEQRGEQDRLLFHIWMPHNDNLRYEPDGFSNRHSNVKITPMPMPSRKNLQSKDFNAERIYQETVKQGISVYWNNIPEIGAELSYLLANYWATGDMTPGPFTLTYNHYTIHDTLPYAVYGYNDLRIKEVLGNYLSDMAVFNSAHNERMLRDNAAEFGLTHWIDDIERRNALVHIPIPVLGDELRPFVEDVSNGYEWHDSDAAFPYDRNGDPDTDGPMFYYNHRLQAYKHWRDTFDLLDSFWKSGHKNFRVNLSYGDGDNSKRVKSDYPFIRLKRTHTHEDYYDALRVPHFNTLNTTHETFCIAIVESALLGGIPIVPDRVTFPDIFPDDYTFMFSDGDEQHELIHNALTGGWSESYLSDEKLALRDHFSQYNVEDVGELAYEELRSRVIQRADEFYTMLKDPDTVDDFFTGYGGGWTPFKTFYNRFSRRTSMGEQAMPTWRFSTLLERYDHRKRIRNGVTEINMDA